MSKADKILATWSGSKRFRYGGSVPTGTTVYCGKDFQRGPYHFEAADYHRMLVAFSGREVIIGTSRTDPPDGSLGAWIKMNLNKSGVTSYIGPILIHEGFAENGSTSDRIRIRRHSD